MDEDTTTDRPILHSLGVNAGRVTIDLSRFFQDYRRYCVVYLDYTRMNLVQDLKTYLMNTFELKENLILLIDEFLLLESDDIRVLKQGDHLWATYPEIYLSESHKCDRGQAGSAEVQARGNASELTTETTLKNISVTNGIDNTGAEEQSNHHTWQSRHLHTSTRKHAEVYLADEAHQQTSKKAKIVLASNDDDESDAESTVSTQTTEKSASTLGPQILVEHLCDKATMQTKTFSKTAGKEMEEEISDWSTAPLPKRKRIRKRRSKNKVKNPTENGKAAESADTNPPVFVPATRPIVRNHPGRMHIRFEESGSNCDDADMDISTSPDPPTSLLVSSVNMEASHNAAHTDLKQLLARTKPVVFERSRPTHPPIPELEKEEKLTKLQLCRLPAQLTYWRNLTDERIWNNPAVTDAPKLDDIVAFKVLCLGQDYTPQLSPWVIACVTVEAEQKTDKLQLAILRGSNPFYREAEGKFDMKDTLEEQNEDTMIISWEELVTPRKLNYNP